MQEAYHPALKQYLIPSCLLTGQLLVLNLRLSAGKLVSPKAVKVNKSPTKCQAQKMQTLR